VYYTDGVRLAVEERYEEALGEFQKAIALDPDHDPSHYEAANIFAEQGETEKALEHSARAAALDPQNNWYRGQQVRLLATLARYDEALAICEEMVSGGSGFNPENYRMLALLYYQKDRVDEALATLDSVAVRMGPTPEVVEMKRGMLIEAGRIPEAATITEEYVKSVPFDESNRLALAEIYGYQRRGELQEATLREVMAINPDNVVALSALADLYLGRGEIEMFVSTMKQLFTLPDVPLTQKKMRLETLIGNTNFYRGHYFEVGELTTMLMTEYPSDDGVAELYVDHAMRGGDTEGALAILKRRLGRPDPQLSTFMKTIQVEAYLERADSVERWSNRALEFYPDEIEIYLLYSGAQQYMKRPKEAQKTLSRALKVATTDSLRGEIYGAIGTLWHEEGNLKKTFAAYEKSLEFNPNNALVLNNYAYFLSLEDRELDRALGMAQRAVRLEENFATYLDTYAWVLYKTGDYAEARRVMQQALPLDGEQNPELMMHYGDILWALGEKYMASTYWKKARDAGWEPVSEIEERLSRE
jgi:tetratricopeptide (TPR) repeat protein